MFFRGSSTLLISFLLLYLLGLSFVRTVGTHLTKAVDIDHGL